MSTTFLYAERGDMEEAGMTDSIDALLEKLTSPRREILARSIRLIIASAYEEEERERAYWERVKDNQLADRLRSITLSSWD